MGKKEETTFEGEWIGPARDSPARPPATCIDRYSPVLSYKYCGMLPTHQNWPNTAKRHRLHETALLYTRMQFTHPNFDTPGIAVLAFAGLDSWGNSPSTAHNGAKNRACRM